MLAWTQPTERNNGDSQQRSVATACERYRVAGVRSLLAKERGVRWLAIQRLPNGNELILSRHRKVTAAKRACELHANSTKGDDFMAKKKTTRKSTKKKATTKKAAPKKATSKKAAAKKAPAKKAAKGKGKMSALDAAAKVLGEAGEPLNTREMIEAMADKKYWQSPGGATPHATLYSAILREINKKGTDARFKKVERGKFTLA